MPIFSLITTTRGRPDKLERLLLSLNSQSEQSFELILVNQIANEKISTLVDSFRQSFDIKFVAYSPCGISAARNQGMKSANGQIMAFPDDDCYYPPDLLMEVRKRLQDPACDGISCFVCDESVQPSAGGTMTRKNQKIDKYNVWKTTVSCSFFVNREMSIEIGKFDTSLGIGSPSNCWSGEETDWLLRGIHLRKNLIYYPDLKVFHPQPELFNSAGPKKAFRYGCGTGRVLRKHKYPAWFEAASVDFQIFKAVAALLTLKPKQAIVRLAMAAGRLKSYFRS